MQTDAASMLAEAKRLIPWTRALSNEIEQARHLPAELLGAYHDAGFFRMWYPASIGGPQLSAVACIEILETLSYADASAGWCAGIATGYSRFAGYLSTNRAKLLFDSNVAAGSLAPRGRGHRVSGGYRVSGRWSWGSGIHHSQWVVLTFLTEAEDAPVRIGFVPITDVTVLDTWRVGGLCGTGSQDYIADDVFVADDLVLDSLDPPASQEGGLYRIPLTTLYPFVIVATPLGIARAAMDAFVDLAETKTPVSGNVTLRDKAAVQAQIGRLTGLLESARAYYYATATSVDRLAAEGAPFTMTVRMHARLACAQVAEAAKQVVRGLHEAAGGTAVYNDCLLERQLRDIHAASQHVQAHANNFEFCGRVVLGLDPGTARF